MKQYIFISFLLISFAGFSQKSMRDYTPRAAQLGDTLFTNRGTTGTSTFQSFKSLLFAGTTLQYMRGDGSLATFPTDNAGFSNGAGYLTGITGSQVTTALGFTPYNATNPSGYITSSALSPYLLSSTAASTYQPIGAYLTQTTGDARYSLLAHTHTFASLTSKPTTIAGYGITDAYPLTGNPSGFLIASDIAGKADKSTTLTINGTTFDLSANRTWTIAGGSSTTLTDNLTTSTTGTALDAHQGFIIKGLIDGNTTNKADKTGTADIEITDATKGVILKSPNGTRYRLTVNNDGSLTTTGL